MTDERSRQSPVRRFLVLGDASHQYPMTRGPAPFVLAELPPDDSGVDRVVENVCGPLAVAARYLVVSAGGEVRDRRELESETPVWKGFSMATEFRCELRDESGVAGDPAALAPLMLIRIPTRPAPRRAAVFAATRLRGDTAVFTRVSRFDTDEAEPEALLPQALRVAGALHEHVGTSFEEFHKFDKGMEIETKVNLTGVPSLWTLASKLLADFADDRITGFAADAGNELLRRSYRQQTCEVLEPEDRRGYISLAQLPSKPMFKIKRFTEDGLRREESFHPLSSRPVGPLAEAIAAEFPELRVRPLPDMHRTMFCLNVESVTTGHLYSVELDEVRELAGGRILWQLEVEYDYSRVHDGLDASSVEAELFRLTGLLERGLDRIGVRGERTYYSKLSFLRDGLTGTAVS